jgi:hypothetical protein
MIISMENNCGFLRVIQPFDIEESLVTKREKLKMLPFCERNKNETKLISYLSSGQIVLLVPAAEFDVLSDDNAIIGSWSVYSDGKWLWRDFLIGYVGKYNIALPEDFIANAEQNNWECPMLSEDTEEVIIEYLGSIGFFNEGGESF